MSAIVKTAPVLAMLSALDGIFRDYGLNPEAQAVLIRSPHGTKSLGFTVLAANGLFQYKIPCIRNTGRRDIQGVAFFGDLVHCMESFSCASGKIEWVQENAPSYGDTICCRLRVQGHVSEHRFPCRYLLPGIPIHGNEKFAKKMALHFTGNLLMPALDKLTRFLEESGVPQQEQKISFCSNCGSISAMSPCEVLDLHLPEMALDKGKLNFKLPSAAPFLKAVRMTKTLLEGDESSRINILKKVRKPVSYEFEVESGSWYWRGPVLSMQAPGWTNLKASREQLRLQLELSQRGFNTLRHFIVSIRNDERFRQVELVPHGKRSFRIQTQADNTIHAVVMAEIPLGKEFRIPLPRDFLHRAILLKQVSFQVWKTKPLLTCRNGYGSNVYWFPF